MRTTLTRQAFRPKDGIVMHELEEGETWAQYHSEQPNSYWTHDESWWPSCPLCLGVMAPSP